MSASSVTGIGQGAADGIQKGSDYRSLGVTHLIGPRVVACGTVTLSGGVATVKFPVSMASPAVNYVFSIDAYNSTTQARVTSVTNDAAGNFASFAVAGGATDVVHWSVYNIGFTVG